MNIVAVDIAAPRDDQPGQLEVLGGCAQLLAVDKIPRHATRLGADSAVKLTGAEPVKKAPIHRSVAKHADSGRVAVGQDRFGTVPIADLLETGGDRVERFVPGDSFECLVLPTAHQRTLS